MSKIITVTIAPGGSVTISPHPSGLAQLGPLTLRDGETLQVTEAEAERLYRQGDILHPVTGLPKPAPARVTVPTIAYGNGRPIPVSDEGALVAASTRAEREALAAVERREEERAREEARREGRGQERRAPVSVSRHPTGSVDPLGPICGLSPSEGGWA